MPEAPGARGQARGVPTAGTEGAGRHARVGQRSGQRGGGQLRQVAHPAHARIVLFGRATRDLARTDGLPQRDCGSPCGERRRHRHAHQTVAEQVLACRDEAMSGGAGERVRRGNTGGERRRQAERLGRLQRAGVKDRHRSRHDRGDVARDARQLSRRHADDDDLDALDQILDAGAPGPGGDVDASPVGRHAVAGVDRIAAHGPAGAHQGKREGATDGAEAHHGGGTGSQRSHDSSAVARSVLSSRYFTITGVCTESPSPVPQLDFTARAPGTTTAPAGISSGWSAVAR